MAHSQKATPNTHRLGLGITLMGLLVSGCDSQEAVRVSIPVVVDGGGLGKVQTDLGYEVEVTQLRLALRDLQFTIRGEMHASRSPRTYDRVLKRALDLLISPAYAHPGHLSGGEVTGELPGPFVIDFAAGNGKELGKASLITGSYQGGNFTFRKAAAADSLSSTDPLLGHTAYIEGRATKGAQTLSFRAQVDVDEGTQLVGAPFSLLVSESSTGPIGLKPLTQDPALPKTLFDGLDFAALDPDGDGMVALMPGQDAHNVLRRTIQIHDFYVFSNR
jgi:hypothetical protein